MNSILWVTISPKGSWPPQHFGADLVVMGTHGRRGWRRLVLGSVAERFLRIFTRPVLLVPLHSREKKEPRKVSTPDVAGASI
ncbi:universal stress protein [Caballeronia sordidicola]|uniref:universal stress protein n=1 Tax=Caballeronia sordidicola TaxID=196367 RepID=UPI00359439A4